MLHGHVGRRLPLYHMLRSAYTQSLLFTTLALELFVFVSYMPFYITAWPRNHAYTRKDSGGGDLSRLVSHPLHDGYDSIVYKQDMRSFSTRINLFINQGNIFCDPISTCLGLLSLQSLLASFSSMISPTIQFNNLAVSLPLADRLIIRFGLGISHANRSEGKLLTCCKRLPILPLPPLILSCLIPYPTPLSRFVYPVFYNAPTK